MIRVAGVLLVLVAAALPGAACGQSGSAASAKLSLRPFATGFDSPVYVTAPRSEPGKLYVVEQPGVIRVLVNGKLRAKPFLDIRSLVRSGGEQGLLSVAFHPGYAHNHRFFVDYTDRNGDTRVVEYRSNGTAALPKTARRLLFVDQPYANHNGGQLQFGPDGRLYVGMGDGGSGGDPGNRAQNLNIRLGKLLRLNVDKRGASWQVAGYGLRNPWRFSFDRLTHDLYIGDVGQNALGGGRRANAPPVARAEQLRLARLGGPLALHARPAGEPARHARLPDRRLQPLARAARSRAVTSTAAGRSSRLTAATSTATTAAARSGACAPRRASSSGPPGASRSRSRTSRRSARTRPASSTRPRSTARSTSSRVSPFCVA